MPTWAKVGLGCGCLLLIIGLVIAGGLVWGAKKAIDVAQDFQDNPAKAAETLINLDPNLEVVENNPEDGRITIRDARTGEESTFDYSDIQEGKISFESDQGSYNIDASEEGGVVVNTPEGQTTFGLNQDVPSWVPFYPNMESEEQGGMAMTTDEKASGMKIGTSADSLDDVDAWYAEKLEADGCEVERNTMSFNNTQTVMFNCKKDGIDSLSVAINREGGAERTTITVTYEGPKE